MRESISVGWRDMRQDMFLDLLENGVPRGDGQERLVLRDYPGVDCLGLEITEDGDHIC